jgi:hypothetical protein
MTAEDAENAEEKLKRRISWPLALFLRVLCILRGQLLF